MSSQYGRWEGGGGGPLRRPGPARARPARGGPRGGALRRLGGPRRRRLGPCETQGRGAGDRRANAETREDAGDARAGAHQPHCAAPELHVVD